FESLVSYTADLQPRGQLAERWETSADGLTYTFYLRRNVKWHDGRPFTADDVVFTAEAALDEQNRSRMRPYYYFLAKPVRVEKIDAGTVRFTLPSPSADFLWNLSQWNLMMPRHLLEGENLRATRFNVRPVGTGPFRFVRLEEGQLIWLAANPFYHLGRPKIDVWVDRGFDDQLTALAALSRGEVDLVALDTLAAVEIARRIPGIKIYQYSPGWIFSLNLNHKAGFFGDLRVRQALAYAFDREHLARTIAGAPAAWSLIGPPASWAYDPNVPKYPKDIDRAKQLLQEAGLKPGPGGVLQKDGALFSFTILFEAGATDADPEPYALALRQAFRAIGADVRIEALTKGTLRTRTFADGDYEAYLGWNGYNFNPDPRFLWHSKSAINNYGNPELDQLIEQAASASRPEGRKRSLDAIAVKIAKDAAFIPLYNFSRYVAARNSWKFPPPSAADFSFTGVAYDVQAIEKAR
ncbi:MAG: ABC transporter substrate-binding protein, partial [bacterium]